jgi:signal transduction histidine kinase
MMIQSDKMMSVGGLAAGMAHEINNPLAGILGSLQVIQKRYEDGYKKNEMVAEECGVSLEKMREYREKSKVNYMVELMAEACHRVSKIVNNVLSFSRKQDMESASFHEMSDLLDRVVYIASHDYNLKKKYDFRLIKIVRDYSEVPKVFCVDSMIQQVFFNILQNAAEAMFGSPDPHFVFTITETKEYVCINIADNGPGMPPEVQTRLFEPFYTTKGTQGTGLGLSIAYHIITVNHRGTIEVDSVEGEGTTFTVCLPKRETYG